MSDFYRDETDKRTPLAPSDDLVPFQRPEPCDLASHYSPEITLFLSLNCPRCGQLAILDQARESQPCLAEFRGVSQFMLSGGHHDHRQ